MTTEVRTMAAKEPEDEPGLKKNKPPSTEKEWMNSLTRATGVWPPKMELPSPKENDILNGLTYAVAPPRPKCMV